MRKNQTMIIVVASEQEATDQNQPHLKHASHLTQSMNSKP
jgi:hypothetical protein